MRSHDTDVIALVFGALFVGAAVLWGFPNSSVFTAGQWRLPTLLIGVGVLGLVVALTRHRDDT